MRILKPTPILFFSGNEYHPLYISRALNEDKYSAYFLGLAGQAIRFSRYCKKYFVCASTDTTLIKQINSISRQHRIAALIPLDLSATVCIRRIRKNIACPVIPISNLNDIMDFANKWKTALRFKSVGIKHPKTILVRSPQELSEVPLTKPFLVKPIMQDSGKGIQKIYSVKELDKYNRKFSPYKTFPLIAQEYITGTDIDLSLIAKDGIIYGWTTQVWRQKGELEFVNDPEVLSIGRQLIHDISYSGLMHIDMRRDVTTGKLYVLECNTRSWGSIGASINAGVDFINVAIQLAQNRLVSSSRQQPVTYVTPIRLLLRSLRDTNFYFQASHASKKYFFRMVTDPLPYIVMFVKMCLNHISLSLWYMVGDRKRLIEMERNSYFSRITDR